METQGVMYELYLVFSPVRHTNTRWYFTHFEVLFHIHAAFASVSLSAFVNFAFLVKSYYLEKCDKSMLFAAEYGLHDEERAHYWMRSAVLDCLMI